MSYAEGTSYAFDDCTTGSHPDIGHTIPLGATPTLATPYFVNGFLLSLRWREYSEPHHYKHVWDYLALLIMTRWSWLFCLELSLPPEAAEQWLRVNYCVWGAVSLLYHKVSTGSLQIVKKEKNSVSFMLISNQWRFAFVSTALAWATAVLIKLEIPSTRKTCWFEKHCFM